MARARGKAKSSLRPPFLRRLALVPEAMAPARYPFDLPVLAGGALVIDFTRPITILVGENGTGKSTLLEAIARQSGFNLRGGNRNHRFGGGEGGEEAAELASALRLSWLPRMTDGFFMRAESFFDFANYMDAMAGGTGFESYGGKPLQGQSHGESFLALFGHRFGRRGLYILDEPEAALSPSRQLAFLVILKELEERGEAQFLIATHSPILMAYPGAQLLELKDGAVAEADYRDTAHFKLMRRFLDDPERYVASLLAPEPEPERDRADEAE